jgi:hypothetical protein
MSKARTKRKAKGSKRHVKIRDLRCYQEVYERICSGYPIPEVARFVQEEEGEYTDVTRASLCELLRRFANDIVPVDLIAPRLPHMVVKATKEFGDRLEDLRRLEMWYQVALYRLDLAHGEERRTGKINPKVDKQLRLVVDLIVKMHDTKLDLGLTGTRELGSLTVSAERLDEIRTRYGDGAARAFADPVQRAQVLGLLKRVKRLAGREDLEEAMPVEASGGQPIDARNEVDHPVWDDEIDEEPVPITRSQPAARPISPVQPRQELRPMDRTGLLPLYIGSDDLDDD